MSLQGSFLEGQSCGSFWAGSDVHGVAMQDGAGSWAWGPWTCRAGGETAFSHGPLNSPCSVPVPVPACSGPMQVPPQRVPQKCTEDAEVAALRAEMTL